MLVFFSGLAGSASPWVRAGVTLTLRRRRGAPRRGEFACLLFEPAGSATDIPCLGGVVESVGLRPSFSGPAGHRGSNTALIRRAGRLGRRERVRCALEAFVDFWASLKWRRVACSWSPPSCRCAKRFCWRPAARRNLCARHRRAPRRVVPRGHERIRRRALESRRVLGPNSAAPRGPRKGPRLRTRAPRRRRGRWHTSPGGRWHTSPSRNIHVAAAASPDATSAESSHGTRGVAASEGRRNRNPRRRRRDPRTQVPRRAEARAARDGAAERALRSRVRAAAPNAPISDDPRLRGISTS